MRGNLVAFYSEKNRFLQVNKSAFEEVSCENAFFVENSHEGRVLVENTAFFNNSVDKEVFYVEKTRIFMVSHCFINGTVNGGAFRLYNVYEKKFINLTVSAGVSEKTAIGIKIIDDLTFSTQNVIFFFREVSIGVWFICRF